MKLCVLLWAVPGQDRQLIEYEDRVRSQDPTNGPLEVHILEFPSEDALEQYMADPVRSSWSALRDRAIARTEVLRVDDVEPVS